MPWSLKGVTKIYQIHQNPFIQEVSKSILKGFRAKRLWEVAGWQWQLHVGGHVDPRTPNLGETSLRWEVFRSLGHFGD